MIADNTIVSNCVLRTSLESMSAFFSLIFFLLLAAISMAIVAYMNFKVEKDQQRREKLRLYKVRLEDLEDMVLVLDTLCESRAIPRLVNDEIVDIYHDMIELDPKAAYLQAGQALAQNRSQELANESADRVISRLCHSDSQMAKKKHYSQQAILLLKQQHTKGRISMAELQSFTQELHWVILQTDVVSFIAQGHKAYIKNDVLTANAFYKKAQTALLRSNHPDERRSQMIKQVADILFGRRKFLDEDLMPETEFNSELAKNIDSIESDLSGEDSTHLGENGEGIDMLIQAQTETEKPTAHH